MGASLGFSGRQTEPTKLEEAISWARTFARDMEWECADVSFERSRGVMGTQPLERPQIAGLSLTPHFACEPVPLLFLESTGQLVDSVVIDEGDGVIRVEPQVMVKTQFAGAAVHAEVCGFLAELRQRFIPDLQVDDETGFSDDGDEARLQRYLDTCWDRLLEEIREVAEPGDRLEIGGIPVQVPPTDAYVETQRGLDEDQQRILKELELWLVTRYGGFGLEFDRSRSAVEHLDLLMHESDQEGWCADPEDEDAERLAHGLGAAFGSTVEMLLGARWEADEEEGFVLADVGGVGLSLNPFQVAADRIAHGPSRAFAHHLAVYEDLARRLRARPWE